MENITINSIGGYTNILEAGQHPAWGTMVSHSALSCKPTCIQCIEGVHCELSSTSSTLFTLHKIHLSSGVGQALFKLIISIQADHTAAVEVSAPLAALARSKPLAENKSEDGGSNQVNKWGFAPGEDDTQDLNLENKGELPGRCRQLDQGSGFHAHESHLRRTQAFAGSHLHRAPWQLWSHRRRAGWQPRDLTDGGAGRMIMGDTTYDYVHGNRDSTLDATQGLQQLQQTRADGPTNLDSLLKRAEGATDILRSAIKGNMESPGSHHSPLGRPDIIFACLRKRPHARRDAHLPGLSLRVGQAAQQLWFWQCPQPDWSAK